MTGCWANGTPLCALADGCVVIVSWLAGGGGAAVISMVFDVTPVKDVALKLNVRDPAAPLIDRFVNVATPLALVVAAAVPPRVPPPLAIAAVTTTPDWLTALFDASRS